METVIRIIGTVIAVIGLVYMVRPQIMRTMTRFFTKGSRLYIAAIVRFALAIIFIMGARHCGRTWIIILFGLIFLISGLLIFMMGLSRAKVILRWFLEQPKFVARVAAGIVIAVGLIIVYAA